MNNKQAEHCINQIIIEEGNILRLKADMDSAASDYDRYRLRKNLETSIAGKATWELMLRDED